MHCYFYIQLPLVNTPVQPSLSARERSHFPPNSVRRSVPSRRARYKTLNVFLRLVRQQEIISFHKHVTHSGFTLIGVKLIDGVGGQVNMWSHKKASCEVHKLHKELQREGVCHSNVMLLWECARIRKRLKLNAPLYNSAHTHLHSSTNDSERVLCLLAQI